jgi:outer membrane protein OmpA-like peptidoglycan-associated protein
MGERTVQLNSRATMVCEEPTTREINLKINSTHQESANLAPFSSKLAVLLLASAVAIPVIGQQPAAAPQSTAPAAASSTPSSSANPANTNEKEGFWGRVNPCARKVWVKKRIDPINDRLTELDALNAKNSKDIQDVDSRAQAGIKQAQTAAEAANQTATAAGTQAQQASATAQGASGHVNQLNTTVSGLDQFHQVTEAEITFRGGLPKLSDDARKQLDDLATTVNGQKGYILEIEAHAPGAGSVGIQNSERLAEAVKRYLVTEHNIPVYRMHAVALGNALSADASSPEPGAKPVRVKTSTVHIRLMENSLAAQGAAPPQGAAS